jgi:hypothetical protein
MFEQVILIFIVLRGMQCSIGTLESTAFGQRKKRSLTGRHNFVRLFIGLLSAFCDFFRKLFVNYLEDFL